MMLSDVRDYIASLGISEHTYMAKSDNKKEKSIGVYASKHEQPYKKAIGGAAMESYGVKRITMLIHWNKSYRETEMASRALFQRIESAREVKVNETTIKFIQPLVEEPVPVDTDDNGIYEMVIEAAVIYERKGQGETE